MWKENGEETRLHFKDWWEQKGLVLGMWGELPCEGSAHEEIIATPDAISVMDSYTDPVLRARRNHNHLAQSSFPADVLPISNTDIGPGSLALFLGCEPGFSEETVWFKPFIQSYENPEELPPLQFDESNAWWQKTEATLKACVELGRGKYLVGCPDLVENVDILASMREPQQLMMDMLDRPEWVEMKIAEINRVWFDVYQRIYDIIKLEDGSSAFGAFYLWGTGKVAKIQCDTSAMFCPDMFRSFVCPGLREQCQWLDKSLYHLDGTQALCHLDALLEIEDLDAIEWSPQAGIEGGGNPRWFDMYKKILDSGKSIQAVGVEQNEVLPLLDAIGGKGVYIMTSFDACRDAEKMMKEVEPYR